MKILWGNNMGEEYLIGPLVHFQFGKLLHPYLSRETDEGLLRPGKVQKRMESCENLASHIENFLEFNVFRIFTEVFGCKHEIGQYLRR